MTANLEQILKKLLNEVGSPPHSNIAPIDYGGNNRVFRVTTPQRTLLLKQYFKHPSDPRHRAHTEFTFSEYAWQKGVRNLAQPIAIDDSSEFALYEFIEGTRLRSEEIDRNAIDCVLDFFFALNTCLLYTSPSPRD